MLRHRGDVRRLPQTSALSLFQIRDVPLSKQAKWIWLLAAAAFFFAISLSADVERVTSPHGSWHVILRKTYSVIAFGILGFMYARIRGGTRTGIIASAGLTLGCYSALIEVAQYLDGSKEGLLWNGIDTFCGLLGGLLGGYAAVLFERARRT